MLNTSQLELGRQQALRAYNILDSASEPGFDDLALLAAQVCQTPIAILGFIDGERYWIKANHGLKLDTIPRGSILYPLDGPVHMMVVPDAATDERLAQHPMVMLWPKVRLYAGAPILSAHGELIGLLEVLDPAPHTLDEAQQAALAALARQATAQLELRRAAAERAADAEKAARAAAEITGAYDATLESMARALDQRDGETEGHLGRVAETTVKLAAAMGVPQAELANVRRGALLHDIGKMGIPDKILLKPSALTDEEWAVVRLHPIYAHEMLSPIRLLLPALDIPYGHHERWNGEGYPRRLKGEQIPLAARIFAVVDVWDALRSDRPYRTGWVETRARDFISQRAGTDFDPAVVEAFLKME
ncbi:MAG: HD domain-containing phosphohydrolase [Anaerolineales bacterium]